MAIENLPDFTRPTRQRWESIPALTILLSDANMMACSLAGDHAAERSR
jgi:hypothetical protein